MKTCPYNFFCVSIIRTLMEWRLKWAEAFPPGVLGIFYLFLMRSFCLKVETWQKNYVDLFLLQEQTTKNILDTHFLDLLKFFFQKKPHQSKTCWLCRMIILNYLWIRKKCTEFFLTGTTWPFFNLAILVHCWRKFHVKIIKFLMVT